MKRIVWISAAFLVMFLIIGVSLHTINQINRTNKQYREEEEAKSIAATIAAVTENETTIWEYIRDNTVAEAESEPATQNSVEETVSADPTEMTDQQNVITIE